MSRSKSRGRSEGPDENAIAKKEFITNLKQMLHFYNNLPKVTQQFNPFEPYLKVKESQQNLAHQSVHNSQQSVNFSAGNRPPRFENMQSLGANDDSQYIDASQAQAAAANAE